MNGTSNGARNPGERGRSSYNPEVEAAHNRGVQDDIEHLHGPAEVSCSQNELVLVSLVRDGQPRVESFLDYHFSLGVKHIVLLDNGSENDTVAIAREYESVTVLRTTLPLETREEAARRYLTNRFGKGHWVLYLDIDERFDYPYSDVVGLDSLIEYLSLKSYTVLPTQTLDGFSEKPLLSTVEGADKREGIQTTSSGQLTPLTQRSLMFVDREMAFMDMSVYWVAKARLADLTGVIFRSRFVKDFQERAARPLRDEQNVSESYMMWADRKEEENPPRETLRERPFRLAEAFCRAKSEREARTRSARELKGSVQDLTNRLSEERKKAESMEQKSRHLETQLDEIRDSRAWRTLNSLARARDMLSGKRTLRARELISVIKHVIRWDSGKGDPAEQVEKIAKRDTSEQVANKNSDFRQSRSIIGNTRKRLYSLGFTERALEDLKNMATDESRHSLQTQAAWELSVWYADQRSEEDARRCLEYLTVALQAESDSAHRRRAATIEAEAQEALGNIEAARLAISRILASGPHADLFLALANLEASQSARIEQINKALQLHGLSRISFDASTDQPLLDSLKPEQEKREGLNITNGTKVSVIVPVYNAEDTVQTALGSILSQTWADLEVLVVDDCSTDATVQIVEGYTKRDSRVHLIRAEANNGPYVARNLALRVATGEFVTCHDADDWSHPEKIETQLLHLLNNPLIIGNTSQQARATPDLEISRRRNPGFYVFKSMPSFMFRREPVMEAIGYWDRVRFGADGEFIKRAKKVFGEESVLNLPTGPLSFQRQSSSSLTGNETFGFHGNFFGARREHLESHEHFHNTAENLRYEFPQDSRPFAVPEPMWLVREAEIEERRHFDVILASDFRLPGGNTSSNVEEIKAQRRMGLRTGLIQMFRYDVDPNRRVNPKIRELLDGDRVQMLVHGEKASCDMLVLRHPPILQEWQRFVPDVEAENIRVIVNQTPMRDYGDAGELLYTIGRCEKHLRRHFGKAGVWHPIGPAVREALYRHHAEELKEITLADEDWLNIIDVEDWRRESRPEPGPRPQIGRHSRDSHLKWPADRSELLAAYPDSDDYEVHVLGGAETPREVLGGLPENWYVLEFGEVRPKDFLSTLDVFVYYTHPDWVEAFGRTIIEAMAVGVPVILPHSYQGLFEEAAIYAEPLEVKATIDRLMSDDDYYESRAKIAYEYVEEHFGYTRHAARLRKEVRS